MTPRPVENALLVDVVHEVEQAEYARKEQNGQSQQNVARVGQRVESVPGVAHCEMVLNPSVLAKLARSTVNCAPKNSVPTAVPSRKVPAMPLTIRKALNVFSPRKVRRLASVLVRDGLNDEYEQDQHP